MGKSKRWLRQSDEKIHPIQRIHLKSSREKCSSYTKKITFFSYKIVSSCTLFLSLLKIVQLCLWLINFI